MTSLQRFIEEMPKAELHLHIEGTLEPEMMMKLADRNNIALPYNSVTEVQKAYDFSCLQDFLDLYYNGMSVLIKHQDFFDLTFAYLKKMHEQNVRHVEIFFDPQGHTERGIAFDTVLSGITDALGKAREDFGISSKLIMCILRHLPQEDAFETMKDACRHKDAVYAIGLDSSEIGNPPSKFADVFAFARNEGFKTVAHAGEEGPAEYVIEALDLLKVARIDHGNRAMDAPELVNRLSKLQIPLTVCPLSNQRLQVEPDLKKHPLRKMLQAGLCVTVNSDDPSYFGGYMSENFLAMQEALNLTKDEIVQLGRNAFIGSFLSDAEKTRALKEFDHFVETF